MKLIYCYSYRWYPIVFGFSCILGFADSLPSELFRSMMLKNLSTKLPLCSIAVALNTREERARLTNEILTRPENNNTYLRLANILETFGARERAQFIRLQIQNESTWQRIAAARVAAFSRWDAWIENPYDRGVDSFDEIDTLEDFEASEQEKLSLLEEQTLLHRKLKQWVARQVFVVGKPTLRFRRGFLHTVFYWRKTKTISDAEILGILQEMPSINIIQAQRSDIDFTPAAFLPLVFDQVPKRLPKEGDFFISQQSSVLCPENLRFHLKMKRVYSWFGLKSDIEISIRASFGEEKVAGYSYLFAVFNEKTHEPVRVFATDSNGKVRIPWEQIDDEGNNQYFSLVGLRE